MIRLGGNRLTHGRPGKTRTWKTDNLFVEMIRTDAERVVFGVFLAALTSACGSEREYQPEEVTTGDHTSLPLPVGNTNIPQTGENHLDFTRDGVWSWFGDPRAVCYSGISNSTYVGWISKRGDVQVGSYEDGSTDISSATLHPRLQVDDHDYPSLLVHPDGRITAFYSSHSGEPMYFRTTLDPEDISSWSEEQKVPTNTRGVNGYTYPNPYMLADEGNRIYLFWRGGAFRPTFSFTDDLRSWAAARDLIHGTEARPYVKYISNSRDRIAFAFTDGHPRNVPNNNIYYAYYRNGGVYRADGTLIRSVGTLPIGPSEADLIHDAEREGARAWIWDIALDSRDFPVIVYASLPSNTDHRYHYARWDGTAWRNQELVAAGPWFPTTKPGKKEPEPHYSGGITLDHDDPNIVYLSREKDGVFEIERWRTADEGTTWTVEPITANSGGNNVRPVVPRGSCNNGPTVLWVYGRYVHYTNYATGIKMW